MTSRHHVAPEQLENQRGSSYCWLGNMSDGNTEPKDPTQKGESGGEMSGVSAKALDDLEERIVKRILDRVAQRTRERAPVKQLQKGE